MGSERDRVPSGAAEADTRDVTTSPPARSPAVIRAELAEAQRYLTDAPPHHGAGTRQVLQARIAALQRELAAGEG